MNNPAPITEIERATYEWQMWVPGFGEAGQEKLKAATVLISRCGGVGGAIALELAAAGIGRLILAHAGNLKPSDLNRQILMTAGALGQSRVECAARRLRELNPRLEIITVPENISEANADKLVNQADMVVSSAPLFGERLAMNRAAVRQKKPLVDAAMYEMQIQVTTVQPGQSPCLTCLYPEPPADWKRQFPVFGAVSGVAGCIGAAEVIKVLAGLGEPLYGRLLVGDLRNMSFRTLRTTRDPHCSVCGEGR